MFNRNNNSSSHTYSAESHSEVSLHIPPLSFPPSSSSSRRYIERDSSKEIFKIVWIGWVLIVVVFMWVYTAPERIDSKMDVPKFLVDNNLLDNKKILVPLYSYDKNQGQWIASPPDSKINNNNNEYSQVNNENHLNLKELRFVTYNVWFGTRRESREELQPRYGPLFQIIQEQDADVICLQEMTKNTLGILLDEPWVRESYWVSDIYEPATFGGYGVVILSRLPAKYLKLIPLPTRLGRKALIAEFNINGESLAVATSHLESYAQDIIYRSQQLQVLMYLLDQNRYRHAVLMGDFNFASAEERETTIRTTNYTDLWIQVHGSQEGYTFDPVRNQMTSRLTGGSTSRGRIDVIIYRTSDKQWKGTEARLLGTDPIAGLDPVTYPSDHFGVFGRIVYSAADKNVM